MKGPNSFAILSITQWTASCQSNVTFLRKRRRIRTTRRREEEVLLKRRRRKKTCIRCNWSVLRRRRGRAAPNCDSIPITLKTYYTRPLMKTDRNDQTTTTAAKFVGDSKTFLDSTLLNVSNLVGRRKPSSGAVSGLSCIEKTTVMEPYPMDSTQLSDKDYLEV